VQSKAFIFTVSHLKLEKMKNKLLIIIVLMLSMPVKGDCKFENGNGLLTGIWRSPVTKTNSVCPSVIFDANTHIDKGCEKPKKGRYMVRKWGNKSTSNKLKPILRKRKYRGARRSHGCPKF